MTEPDRTRWDALEFHLDYDDTRWILVPRRDEPDAAAFARRLAADRAESRARPPAHELAALPDGTVASLLSMYWHDDEGALESRAAGALGRCR